MKINSIKTGFTLVELLVSIAIIGILTAVLMPNFIGSRQKAKDSQRIQELDSVKKALRMYYNDHQDFPVGTQCTDCLNSILLPYMNNISQIGYTYEQLDDGDAFRLTVGLEASGGDEDINSQSKCGVSAPIENIFAVCSY